ncbi:MAG: isopenicillin N synthase family dioxygenase [Galactobacter sp.]
MTATTDFPTPTETAPRRELPVLDLSTARNVDGSFNPEFLEKLRDAAHNVGFFQLIGYGARSNQAQELLDTLAEFFSRPVEERLELDNRLTSTFRGYTRLGAERTQGRADSREQIDYGPDREPEANVPAGQEYLRLQGHNLFPSEYPVLEERAMAWAELMSATGAELLSALLTSIGVDPEHFADAFADKPAWMGKLVHYVGGDLVPGAGKQGVGAHADYGFVTLLLQDQIGGLEVQPHGQEEWIDVDPIPGALVVNLGEMLEVATDGYLMATIHRVTAPPAGVDRYSVPFFWSPRLDATVDAVDLPADLAANARGKSDDPNNPMLSVYGANMLKGFLRAHPEVAKRHYPELV